jgi:hypothetical protein
MEQEDEQLEDYLEELRGMYGDFDEDYVVGLIAAGVEGDEAVGRFQQLYYALQQDDDDEEETPNYPRVMSGGGGVPDYSQVDTSKMTDQDTQELIAEILRLSHDQ